MNIDELLYMGFSSQLLYPFRFLNAWHLHCSSEVAPMFCVDMSIGQVVQKLLAMSAWVGTKKDAAKATSLLPSMSWNPVQFCSDQGLVFSLATWTTNILCRVIAETRAASAISFALDRNAYR